MATLADNLRELRIGRGMSQQILAEHLGLSVAAVSKWESGQSRPDIDTLLRLASLYQVSTDRLLNHQAGLLSAQQTATRIKELTHAKRFEEGMRLAEQALVQYPNHFDLSYESALLYSRCHLEGGGSEAADRAMNLLERAAALISQNTRPEVSWQSIQGESAFTLMNLGKREEALALYRANNVGGMFDENIGSILSTLGRHQEALEPLSDAYLCALAMGFNSMTSLAMSLVHLDRAREGLAVLRSLSSGLRQLLNPRAVSGIERMLAFSLSIEALLHCELQQEERAKALAREALRYARRYDAAPDASCQAIAHYHGQPRAFFDNMGTPLAQGIFDKMGDIVDESLRQRAREMWQTLLEETDNENA